MEYQTNEQHLSPQMKAIPTTRRYQVRAAAALLLLTAALTTACTDSLPPRPQNEAPTEGRFFSVTATPGGGADTRVTHTPDGNGNFIVKWAAADQIHVGKRPSKDVYITGDQFLSSLDIVPDGAGQSKARFEGTIAPAHQPAAGDTLFAFYGKPEKMAYFYSYEIHYNFAGQRQTVNNNWEHLADYDFMTAIATYNPDAGADHYFCFSHAGSVMKFTLGGLEGLTVTKLTLCTQDGTTAFASELGSTMIMNLALGAEDGSGITIAPGGKLEAYLMLGASKYAKGKKLVVYATTTDGKRFAARLKGADIAAAKSYTVDATLTEYAMTGKGTENEPYTITDEGDLNKMAVMVNTGMLPTEGKFFRLTRNIELTGAEEWLPIGVSSQPFKGTFSGADGNGGNYSITNLKYEPDSIRTVSCNAGLFGYSMGATIKNVTVGGKITLKGKDNATIVAGGITGYATGNSTIKDCVSRCTIQVTGGKPTTRVGGIVGQSSGSNWEYGDNTVTNCKNEGDVTSSMYVGGIVGELYAQAVVTGCTNTGSIATTGTEYTAGGIIGLLRLNNYYQNSLVSGWQHSGSLPVPGEPGSVIGSYILEAAIADDKDLSYVTIKENASDEGTVIKARVGAAVEGSWPETSGQ